MKFITVIMVMLLILLQYRLWTGNGSLIEVSLLRDEITRINTDIDLKQEIEIGGETTEMDIPMTVEFFWPKADR